MTQPPGHEQTTIGKWLFMCGAAIVALGFLLTSSVFGAIDVPNHTQLGLALTPSPLPPTPSPTPIPPPTLPASAAPGTSSATDVILLVALMVVLALIGTLIFITLLVRLAKHNTEAAPAPQPPPAQPSPVAVAPQPSLDQHLKLLHYTLHCEADIATKQAARHTFWRGEYAKNAEQRVKRDTAAMARAQHEKSREPAVLRNSKRLHGKTAPDAAQASRNGKTPHKDAGPRL